MPVNLKSPVGRQPRATSSSTPKLNSPPRPVRSPPGTIAALNATVGYTTCQACPDGYYRSGWSSDLSNTCKQIPAGERCSS